MKYQKEAAWWAWTRTQEGVFWEQSLVPSLLRQVWDRQVCPGTGGSSALMSGSQRSQGKEEFAEDHFRHCSSHQREKNSGGESGTENTKTLVLLETEDREDRLEFPCPWTRTNIKPHGHRGCSYHLRLLSYSSLRSSSR